jgi:hypothetical protein
MGWTFGYDWTTRKNIIEDRTENAKWETGGIVVERKCLARTYKGSPWAGVLYSAHEQVRTAQDGTVTTVRYIMIDLLRYSKRDGCWGYKDMDEECGPCQCGCPLKYLEMVPCPDSEFARNWRGKVREYWANRKATRKAA